MDIKKTLRIIDIILEVEGRHNLQSLYQNIESYFQQGNTDELNNTKDTIYSHIESSEIANFVNTEVKILEKLGLKGFFDLSAIRELEKILSLQAHEVHGRLRTFVNERRGKFEKTQNLKNSLDAILIEKDDGEEDKYLIVFSFPEYYHDLIKLEGVTKDIRFFLNELNSTLDNIESYQISSVDNGCIEFFIEASESLAGIYSIAVSKFIELYTLSKALQDGAKIYQHYSKKRKEKLEEITKEQLEEDKLKILKSLVDEILVEETEKRDRIQKLFIKLGTHLEKGVSTEVKTPLLDEPDEIEDNDTDDEIKLKQEKKKIYEKKKKIDERNRQLFLFQNDDIKLALPENIEDVEE